MTLFDRFGPSGGTKRVARAASRPKLHGQGRPGRFHESWWLKEEQKGSVDSGRCHESVVVKQLVAVVAAVIVGTADRPFGDPF